MQLIEETFAKEDPSSDELWQRKVNTANITYYIKKSGSDVNQTAPFLRFEMMFPKAFKI